MILDIDARMVNGKLCLYKFDHKKPDFNPIIDEHGFVTNISIKDMLWQKIRSREELEEIVLMLNCSISMIQAEIKKDDFLDSDVLIISLPARTKHKEKGGKVSFSAKAESRMLCNLNAVFGEDDE